MEFLLLLIVTLLISVIVAGLVILFFRKPIDKIFARILGEDISSAWRKFLTFALFVVGVSSGGGRAGAAAHRGVLGPRNLPDDYSDPGRHGLGAAYLFRRRHDRFRHSQAP